MKRTSRIACLLVAALLVPASAEARKARFGGSKSSPATSQAKPDQARTGRSTVIAAPGLGVSRARADEPRRVPFPPSTVQPQQATPAALRLSAHGEAKKPWCASEVVVGGFCVVN